MATGFASIQRNSVNTDPGYKTLFERINAQTGGEKKSLSWYRNAVKAEASKYKKNFNKYILDEKFDRVGAAQEQDKNELRRYTVAGHLYMFEYKAKMKWLAVLRCMLANVPVKPKTSALLRRRATKNNKKRRLKNSLHHPRKWVTA